MNIIICVTWCVPFSTSPVQDLTTYRNWKQCLLSAFGQALLVLSRSARSGTVKAARSLCSLLGVSAPISVGEKDDYEFMRGIKARLHPRPDYSWGKVA